MEGGARPLAEARPPPPRAEGRLVRQCGGVTSAGGWWRPGAFGAGRGGEPAVREVRVALAVRAARRSARLLASGRAAATGGEAEEEAEAKQYEEGRDVEDVAQRHDRREAAQELLVYAERLEGRGRRERERLRGRMCPQVDHHVCRLVGKQKNDPRIQARWVRFSAPRPWM